MLTVLNDPTGPECFRKLSEDQKRKMIKITIDQMDFTSIFQSDPNAKTQLDKATSDKIQAAIKADKDLGPDVAKCVMENENTLKQVPA